MTRVTRDHRGRPVVAVTGIGVITSLGRGVADNWAALTAGVSGIHTITRFPTDHLRTTIAGTVEYDDPEPVFAPVHSERLAAFAAEEAITMSGIGARGDFPGPLFMAVPPVELDWDRKLGLSRRAPPGEGSPTDRLIAAARANNDRALWQQTLFGVVAEGIADRFGTRGAPISLSTACASGATAIQLGIEAIRRGESEAALVMGTDGSVGPEALIRFSLLSALSTSNADPARASKPFSRNRDGFVMAEGAAALVLEDYDSAVARGAQILGILSGSGDKADDFHRTRSKPDGSPVIAAIRNAIEDAGIGLDEVDYVNAHGTGTPENDKMEAMALEAVFGEALAGIPISSNKSMIGHTLTAAGAVEAIFSLLTIRNGTLPPTINYDVPDPALALDVVPNAARSGTVRHALSNSFGFGGQNVCLIISAEPV